MQPKTKRYIKPGSEFNALFPLSNNGDKTIKRNASLDDTVVFIPKVVRDTLEQTTAIAKKLKGRTVTETCSNIWHFVYGYINYKKDKEGYEQIRSPARTWHDRHQGVDCDCYSVFISSILTNLGMPHTLRITKYNRDHFQHIYPIVPTGNGFITLDCVTDYYDYEVPYSDKKDYPMDLQYLDGLDGATLGLFGKKKKKAAAAAKVAAAESPGLPSSVPAMTPAPAATKPKKKGFFKKVLNVVNKVNPATVLLRNGVLAAMKLNIKNVAKRLRWSYLSPDKIAQHGIDPERFQKLVATRQKLENIFYGAGGKPENFKKAILTGKGNKDKAVSGLGMLPMQEWNGYMNENTPLGELLGQDIYYSENIDGMEGFRGFGDLGEPVTLASVGAAMGVIAGIVAALKQIGSIFKKDSPGAADFDEAATEAPENNVNQAAAANAAAVAVAQASAAATAPTSSSTTAAESGNWAPDSGGSSYAVPTKDSSPVHKTDEQEYDVTSAAASATPKPASSDTPPDKKESFWDKNKKWLKPVTIGTGGLLLIAVGIKLMKSGKQGVASSPKKQSLSGLPRKRKSKKAKAGKHNRKKAIALL